MNNHAYFATQLGKKILHGEKEYILEKISLSHLECMNGTTELQPFVIEECRIILKSIRRLHKSNFPKDICVVKRNNTYFPAESMSFKTEQELNDRIVELICSCSKITVQKFNLNKKKRDQEYVWGRHIHMSVMNLLMHYSLASAAYVYKKNHATVISSKKKVINLLHDAYFVDIYQDVFDFLVEEFGDEAVRAFEMQHLYK